MQQTAKAPAAAPNSATSNVGALLALQVVDDPLTERKKKAVRRGKSMLDKLEQVKADLLVGAASAEKLDSLMAMIGEARERSEPELDALLDDIELRVRVELAKSGRFPN